MLQFQWCRRLSKSPGVLVNIRQTGGLRNTRSSNVCSEYSEHKIQANGRPYRALIHSTWSGSSIRFTFDLFSRMSTRKSLDAQHQGFFYARTCACIKVHGHKKNQKRWRRFKAYHCSAPHNQVRQSLWSKVGNPASATTRDPKTFCLGVLFLLGIDNWRKTC